MTGEDFNHLKELALLHFKIAAARHTDAPLGVAVLMRDGKMLAWSNTPSDMDDADEFIASPLEAIPDHDITTAEDLKRREEVDSVVICGVFNLNTAPETWLSETAKDSLARYPGMRDGQIVHMVDAATSYIDELKL